MTTFKCLKNCSSCCGPVPILREVYEKNKHLAGKFLEIAEVEDSIVLITKDNVCAFLNRQTHRCKIYADRPVVCKAYGIHPSLPCIYLKPDGTRRTRIEQKLIAAEMNQNVDKLIKQIKDKQK